MSMLRRNVLIAVAAAVVSVGSAGVAWSQTPPAAPAAATPGPYTVEYYYKVKWGHQEEFLDLYKKNHYPILKRLQKLGYIREMSAAYPINHAGEEQRWDFRFTIVFKDVFAAQPDPGLDAAIMKELYPDQDAFKKEELRRFELLVEHMDVPIEVDDLAKWP